MAVQCYLWACRDALSAHAFGSSGEGAGGKVPSEHRHTGKGHQLQQGYYRKREPGTCPSQYKYSLLHLTLVSRLAWITVSPKLQCAASWPEDEVVTWRIWSLFIPRCYRFPEAVAAGRMEGTPCSLTAGDWAPWAPSAESGSCSTLNWSSRYVSSAFLLQW